MAQEAQAADYMVWRRFAEMAGDTAMVARLDAINALEQAACSDTVTMTDGTVMRVPLMIAAESAVAAQEGKQEAEWREEWTRRLVHLAVKWQDELTTQGVVAVLNCMDAVIADLKGAGVWPWR
jgi:hypothetical protein